MSNEEIINKLIMGTDEIETVTIDNGKEELDIE